MRRETSLKFDSRVDERISWTNSAPIVLISHAGLFVQVHRKIFVRFVSWSALVTMCSTRTDNNVIYQVNETFKTLVSRSVLRRIALLIDSCVMVSVSRRAATRYINWKRINLRCSLCYRLSSQLRTSIRAIREKRPGKLDFSLNFL